MPILLIVLQPAERIPFSTSFTIEVATPLAFASSGCVSPALALNFLIFFRILSSSLNHS